MNDLNITTIIISIGGAVLTYLGTKISNKASIERSNVENAEKLYQKYQAMVDSLEKKVDKLQEEIELLKNKYEKEIAYYQAEVEKLQDEIDELREENAKLKGEM